MTDKKEKKGPEEKRRKSSKKSANVEDGGKTRRASSKRTSKLLSPKLLLKRKSSTGQQQDGKRDEASAAVSTKSESGRMSRLSNIIRRKSSKDKKDGKDDAVERKESGRLSRIMRRKSSKDKKTKKTGDEKAGKQQDKEKDDVSSRSLSSRLSSKLSMTSIPGYKRKSSKKKDKVKKKTGKDGETKSRKGKKKKQKADKKKKKEEEEVKKSKLGRFFPCLASSKKVKRESELDRSSSVTSRTSSISLQSDASSRSSILSVSTQDTGKKKRKRSKLLSRRSTSGSSAPFSSKLFKRFSSSQSEAESMPEDDNGKVKLEKKPSVKLQKRVSQLRIDPNPRGVDKNKQDDTDVEVPMAAIDKESSGSILKVEIPPSNDDENEKDKAKKPPQQEPEGKLAGDLPLDHPTSVNKTACSCISSRLLSDKSSVAILVHDYLADDDTGQRSPAANQLNDPIVRRLIRQADRLIYRLTDRIAYDLADAINQRSRDRRRGAARGKEIQSKKQPNHEQPKPTTKNGQKIPEEANMSAAFNYYDNDDHTFNYTIDTG